MKVVSSSEMARLEKSAYGLGYKDEDFMSNAGMKVSQHAIDWVNEKKLEKKCLLLIGKGNNGGDAAVAASVLLEKGFQIVALLASPLESASPLCQKKVKNLMNKGVKVRHYDPEEDFPIPAGGFIIDGLFGTGLKEAPKEPYASLIEKANASRLPILSVDIPSGVNGDTGVVKGAAIKAKKTVFLGLPKIGFFINQGFEHIGELSYADFGLPNSLIEEVKSPYIYITKEDVFNNLPKIKRTRHKYEAGAVSIVAGSKEMPGSSLLVASSALRSGAGMVHLFHPAGIENLLAASLYEIIKVPFNVKEGKTLALELNKASCIAIGPGLGQSDEVVEFFKDLISKVDKPLVLDADALNIVAKNAFPLPKGSVLTPHLGEMRRLLETLEKEPVDEKFLEKCQLYAKEKGVLLILKGAPTFIFIKDKIYISAFGDPGMATAGSGDVLTGLIASFIAQGLEIEKAAYIAPAFHGMAGEKAAKALTSYCVIASDIYSHYSDVFKEAL
ncbi:bifunctional ADP-dependent NAD(P)H-hydrate dehydratase/NAD(P)H-hydrate epimerase [Criblamydia sequanensis]|uniref:Bifunctional NAD(P)H-hydrate repair enzyme n=1 Tax=Candidatus Criblamydia sequanensis CRIB-18 TaxID=1437425 RepID=A0A090E0L1_9BACT|nr:bifunctional ADP-dependent NAD(P)H-hydrate dehydratase/NAD(P)H-hydrate epimerase [Criblamydia sequanensis]CDR34344.1 Carbohydrate kinase [Criblamydia sequanensis CRIB-18]